MNNLISLTVEQRRSLINSKLTHLAALQADLTQALADVGFDLNEDEDYICGEPLVEVFQALSCNINSLIIDVMHENTLRTTLQREHAVQAVYYSTLEHN